MIYLQASEFIKDFYLWITSVPAALAASLVPQKEINFIFCYQKLRITKNNQGKVLFPLDIILEYVLPKGL